MYLGYEVGGPESELVPVAYNGDGHILTIGPTRSGKSRRLLIPNLMSETGQSMLVVDMKGELAATTAAHRATRGTVIALDPFGVLASRGIDVRCAGFNPLHHLDPASDTFIDDAMGIAEALVQVSPQMSEPHWAESAQDFVAGIIMLVRCVLKDKATLGIVRRDVSRSPTNMAELAVQAVNSNIHPAVSNKLSKFQEAKGNKEIASIMSVAQTQTRFLDSPGIARNLALNDIDFGDLKKDRLTIYLVLPPERLLTHAKWLRLIISSAMTALQRTLKVKDRPDVLFMLDEFPQLGRLQSVENAVSLNAGYGIKVWAAVQHLGQLKDQYGDNWETFLSAGCVTTFAPRDVFTRDHLTKLIGTGTKNVISITIGAKGDTSTTDSVQKDDLMSPQQWRLMKLGEQIAFIPTKKEQQIRRIYSPDFESEKLQFEDIYLRQQEVKKSVL